MAAKLSSVTAFAAAMLLSLTARAQDDSDLARALAQRGWFDLAEEICDRMDKGAGRSMVPFIRAEILLGQVDRETEYAKA